MGKIEVNNEIILMRPIVRMAKVRIVRSLIREVKILRVKRGDEKKLSKFKRRADRFMEEVEAAKKVKEDEVTKFGIVNTKSLYSILDDLTSDANTRVIAKFADFPELKKRISEFKTKFPDYEQFIGPGRKKLARLERKAALKAKKNEEQAKEISEGSVNKKEKKSRKEKKGSDDEEKNDSLDDEMDVDNDQSDEEDENNEVPDEDNEVQDEDNDEGEDEKEVEEENDENVQSEEENSDEKEEDIETEIPKSISKPRNTKRLKSKHQNETSESETEVEKVPIKKSKNVSKTLKKEKVKQKQKEQKKEPREIKPVSKEATVIRFTDLIEEEVKETSQETKSESKIAKVELIKEVDSFFTTADGSQEYLSIVPKRKVENTTNDDLDHENLHQGRNFSTNKRDRFVNNMDGRSDKFKRRPSKFGKNRADGFNSAPKFGPKDEKRSGEKFGKKFEKPKKSMEAHLHPSWAAKKKQQDVLKMGFQGKKIVFGED